MRSRVEIAEVNSSLETSISGMRVSRAYTAEPHEIEYTYILFKAARSRSYKVNGYVPLRYQVC